MLATRRRGLLKAGADGGEPEQVPGIAASISAGAVTGSVVKSALAAPNLPGVLCRGRRALPPGLAMAW